MDEVTAYLKKRGVTRLDAAYGCSLGGACLTRLLALGELPVNRAIIDGGITPYRFPYLLRRLVLLRDVLGFKIVAKSRRVLEAAFPPERFTLPGHDAREEYDAIAAYLKTYSAQTIRNVFWSERIMRSRIRLPQSLQKSSTGTATRKRKTDAATFALSGTISRRRIFAPFQRWRMRSL